MRHFGTSRLPTQQRFGMTKFSPRGVVDRLQASIPRLGSFWPGASMHAMCMYMHMRTGRSLIAASYALTGRPAPYASWSCGDVSWGA